MSTRTPTDPRSSTDGRLAGATAARQLHREIAGSPDRARRVAVVGAGGSGKSVLLDVLDTAYRDGGVRVARAVPPAGEPLGPDVALVVDDVHLLPEAELDRLAAIAATPSARLVVAHRPWPRPPGLVALGALLAADRAPVVLGPLDRTGVAARAGVLLGQGVAAELVERVAAQTCGIPLLVDRLLAALAARPGPGVPPGLLAQLEYLVATVRPRVRALLRARAVGAPADPEILEPLLDLTGPDAHDLLDELAEEAAAAGLLTPDGAAIPLVSATVLAGTAPSRRVELVRFLAELELARGGDVAAAARGLLAAGATGTRAAAVLAAGADEAVRTGDRAAGELYAAAVRAGVPSLELAARRAEAALLAGDPDAALAHADEVLSAADRLPVADAVRAGTVAAAVFARRGLLARTAELHRWMGALTGAPSLLAVPALVGTGAPDEARAALAAPPPSAPQPLRPPT
ncbi:MAG TPA: hypothetical protein VM367_08445, partial [Pseudonocardia sp.]|nr:hypothetical protein [Pseudonocardia sp.]